MNKTPLLLVPLALLCGAGLWSLFANNADPLPPGNQEASANTVATNAKTDSGSTGNSAVDASAESPDDTIARDAVSTRETLVQIPDDAKWTDVRIVDKATGSALPDATVRWYDATIVTALRADSELLGPDTYSIWLDADELASQFGWQTTSDDKGIARIHRSDGTVVAARHGSLFATASLAENLVPPRDGFKVELEPDFEFAVQVLDASGRPAFGVPIAIAIDNPNNKYQRLVYWDALASTREPDGIARLAHVQQWRNQYASRSDLKFRVRTYLPGLEDPGIQFDMAALPEEPLTLHLPPCGQVRARVEVNGQLADVKTCRLREDVSTRGFIRRASLQRHVGSDGWATFDHVPISKSFRAQATVKGGWVREIFAGPVTDGAVVSVVLTPNEGEILLAGRLLDANRQPLANESFKLSIRGKVRFNSELETDTDGRFLAIVGKVRKDNHTDSIEACLQREGERPLLARVAARELRAGTEDLGDLLLRLDALVVSGRCETDGKPSELSKNSRIERLEVREGQSPRWRLVNYLSSYRADDGLFEYRGTPKPGRYRLRVRGQDHVPIDPLEFALGTQGLSVQLHKGAKLAATMLMPEGVWRPLTATLTRTNTDSIPRQADQNVELPGQVWSRQDGRHQAQWSGLAPGTYDLTLSMSGLPEPIHRITAVSVPSPPNGDPRLVDIDLRERLHVQVIRLYDEAGQQLQDNNGGFFPTGQDPTGTLLGFMCYGHESKVPLPRGTTNLLIGITGYRPKDVQCTGEPLEVRLDAWPTVTLTFPNQPELPEGCKLQASLRPPATTTRRWSAQWRTGQLNDLMAPPSRKKTVINGKVELPIGDDAHTIQLRLRLKRRTITVKIAAQKVRMADRSVAVSVDEKTWKDAIDRVTKK